MKSEFQGHEEVTVFPVEFEENRVVLKISEGRSPSVDIPYPEGLNRDGWTITPYSPPEVRVYVTCCQIRLTRNGSDTVEWLGPAVKCTIV